MKATLKSLLTVILAFMLFSSAVYAWFTNTNRTHIQPVSISVDDGIMYDYEIKYYTKNYVYKYDTVSRNILVYDTATSSWVLPNDLQGDSNYEYQGVLVGHYDLFIPEHNENNNIVIEISFDFTNQNPMFVSHKMISNPAISSSLVQTTAIDTSRPYYLSEVALVQTLLSDAYSGYSDTFNKYYVLTTEFETKDQYNNHVYPTYSFYQNNIYSSTLDLGSNIIPSLSTVSYYYNISYDESRINQFFIQEFQGQSYDVTNIPNFLFFKDTYISFNGGFN